jgi:hypothetical protein
MIQKKSSRRRGIGQERVMMFLGVGCNGAYSERDNATWQERDRERERATRCVCYSDGEESGVDVVPGSEERLVGEFKNGKGRPGRGEEGEGE